MSLRMPLKMFMALAVAAAIAVGLMIPVARGNDSAATSQVELLELGRG